MSIFGRYGADVDSSALMPAIGNGINFVMLGQILVQFVQLLNGGQEVYNPWVAEVMPALSVARDRLHLDFMD